MTENSIWISKNKNGDNIITQKTVITKDSYYQNKDGSWTIVTSTETSVVSNRLEWKENADGTAEYVVAEKGDVSVTTSSSKTDLETGKTTELSKPKTEVMTQDQFTSKGGDLKDLNQANKQAIEVSNARDKDWFSVITTEIKFGMDGSTGSLLNPANGSNGPEQDAMLKKVELQFYQYKEHFVGGKRQYGGFTPDSRTHLYPRKNK